MQPLAPLDAVWLHMDHPTNLMMVTGVLWLDAPLPVQALRRLVEERLVGPYPHFRQRVEERRRSPGGPRWVGARKLDLEWHVVAEQLPAPADQPRLEARIDSLLSTPLDRTRPLWQMHLLQPAPLPDGGTGAALVCRLHHCMADGMALAQVLLGLTDEAPGARGWTPTPHPIRDPHPFARVLDRVWHASSLVAHRGAQVLQAGQELRDHPEKLREALHLAADGTYELGHLAAMLPDHRTRLKGPLGIEKHATWTPSLDLDQLKAVGRAWDATLNDVVIAAMTGALRGWLHEQGDDVPEIRTFIPVDRRDPDQPIPPELGNRLSLVFLALPVGLASHSARLIEVKRRMQHLKASTEPAVAAGILLALGRSPEAVEQVVVEIFGTKASAVMTNVPGPKQPIHLAGRTVAAIQFWVPQAGRVGLGVSIFSYAGRVSVGIAADALRMPRPHQLVDRFLDELQALAAEVGLGPLTVPNRAGPAA